ncbi:unnamed protein product [Prunus armeniaca]
MIDTRLTRGMAASILQSMMETLLQPQGTAVASTSQQPLMVANVTQLPLGALQPLTAFIQLLLTAALLCHANAPLEHISSRTIRLLEFQHGPIASSFTLQHQEPGTDTATYDGTAIQDYLNAISGHISVLEKIHSLPLLPSQLTYALEYASNGALAHVPLGPMYTTFPDPHSKMELSLGVDQPVQKVDNQNNLIGRLLGQINLSQGFDLGSQDKERKTHGNTDAQFKRFQAGRTMTKGQGREQELDVQHPRETQTSAS